jgi:hypothetical protein
MTHLSLSGLLIAILAVWRVTHLLWGEDGPGDVFVRLRRAAGKSIFGRLLDCFYCLSLWIAAPVAWVMGSTWLERGLLWLAFSGGAIVVERLSSRDAAPAPPPAIWHEEPLDEQQKEEKQPDVMLRR